jgi:hypothetical protein
MHTHANGFISELVFINLKNLAESETGMAEPMLRACSK